MLSDDSVTPADEAKLGQFLTSRGFVPNPAADTDAYYNNTCTHIPSGSTQPVTTCSPTSNSIRKQLGTLSQFKSRYGMASSETGTPASGEYVAKYYNRGDLGIGRNMHCKIKSSTNETACYVKNYSSDPVKTFGGSAATAFLNLDANKAFATVAMVSRGGMASTARNKVIFMVYDAAGKLTYTAPLDRHALGNLGIEGKDFNKHIPGNCMVCHGAGGRYFNQTTPPSLRGTDGAMFLPFDLDSFEYHPTKSSLSRAKQEGAFKNLNTKIVQKVANEYGPDKAGAIINNINGWYANGASKTFISSYVPPGWTSRDPTGALFGDKHFFQKVLRSYCRTCHQTFSLNENENRSFETWENFATFNPSLVQEVVCPTNAGVDTPSMPQAEQTSRIFWQSDARGIFAGYLSTVEGDVRECLPGPDR